jgi:hypothetical protein
MSENSDDLILGNHETSTVIHEISINYTSSEEVYDRSTIIVNPCFSSLLKVSLPIQILTPWQSAKGAQIGINGRKQLRLRLTHLKNERCSLT